MEKKLNWENFKNDLLIHGIDMPCVENGSECFYDGGFQSQIRIIFFEHGEIDTDFVDIQTDWMSFNDFVQYCLKELDRYNGYYTDLSDLSDYLFCNEDFVESFRSDFEHEFENSEYFYENGE